MNNTTVIAVPMIAAGLAMAFGGFVLLLKEESSPTIEQQSPKPQPKKISVDLDNRSIGSILDSSTDTQHGRSRVTSSRHEVSVPEGVDRPPSTELLPGDRNTISGSSNSSNALTSEEKGYEFEKWVVQLFNRNYFQVEDWNSDKYVNGIYPQSSLSPDMRLAFKLHGKEYFFAVECKWRKDFERGSEPAITWAEVRQIANYTNYAKQRNIPVFVVIGIGGEPDNPHEVYIVPLDRLPYPRVTAKELGSFRRGDKRKKFFYEPDKHELR